MSKVDILGQKYEIFKEATQEEFSQLKNYDGFTDTSVKKIAVAKFERDEDSIEDLEYYSKKVLRHEIIHAFLYESGLDCNSNNRWARNEEMVDFFAVQIPKMVKIFKSQGCLDVDE